MPNAVITSSMIANEAIMHLENNLVMAGLVYRSMEDEFSKTQNGFKPGTSVTIRKPAQFTVRTGAAAASQDVVEGTTTVSVDKQKGIDFEFTSSDLTLKIGELGDRVIKPAMVQLANEVDTDVMALYRDIPSWVGTPGQTIDSFADFFKGPERMNELAVPMAERSSVLSPSDHAGLISNFAGITTESIAKTALEKAKLPMLGGVDNYMSQNVPTHVVGAQGGTPLIMGAGQSSTYTAVKDVDTQTLVTDGWPNSVTGVLKAGDVFTIAGVYAVNPVSKATLPFLRQFVVRADATSNGTGIANLTINPTIIVSGAFQTVSAAPADNAAINVMGTAGVGYRQNLMFHKDAFALTMVPMVSPPGAVDVSRKSYKGISVRVIPYYDGTNDISKWRLDILYGTKTLDPRLATRQSGTP